MLVSCKKGCILNGGVTSAKFNVDEDRVECDFCEEELTDISSFAKEMMISNGFVKRNRIIESFTFHCKLCDKNVKTVVDNDIPIGEGCSDKCNIDIPEAMIFAIKSIRRGRDE